MIYKICFWELQPESLLTEVDNVQQVIDRFYETCTVVCQADGYNGSTLLWIEYGVELKTVEIRPITESEAAGFRELPSVEIETVPNDDGITEDEAYRIIDGT